MPLLFLTAIPGACVNCVGCMARRNGFKDGCGCLAGTACGPHNDPLVCPLHCYADAITWVCPGAEQEAASLPLLRGLAAQVRAYAAARQGCQHARLHVLALCLFSGLHSASVHEGAVLASELQYMPTYDDTISCVLRACCLSLQLGLELPEPQQGRLLDLTPSSDGTRGVAALQVGPLGLKPHYGIAGMLCQMSCACTLVCLGRNTPPCTSCT